MGKDELIREINRYCSPYSILIITPTRLIRIYTPFKVEVISSSLELSIGDIVIVTKVLISENLYLVYIIDGKGYYYYHFTIIVK